MKRMVGRFICSLVGHRLILRTSFDVEWDFCPRCRNYCSDFRVRAR